MMPTKSNFLEVSNSALSLLRVYILSVEEYIILLLESFIVL